MQLVDDAHKWLRMRSVQINLVWGVVCQVFVVTPREYQAQLVGLLGLHGEGAVTAFAFLAQVCVGVAAATVAARLTSQSGFGTNQ